MGLIKIDDQHIACNDTLVVYGPPLPLRKS